MLKQMWAKGSGVAPMTRGHSSASGAYHQPPAPSSVVNDLLGAAWQAAFLMLIATRRESDLILLIVV
jgi:hypothetical protein